MPARRGGARFTTRRCSVLAVHVSTCSRAKDAVFVDRREDGQCHTTILKKLELTVFLLSTRIGEEANVRNVAVVRRTGSAAFRNN